MDEQRKVELNLKLEELRILSEDFYVRARQSGVHGFIEFTGLMNEMIRIYQKTLDNDIDFTKAGNHSDVPLVALAQSMKYLQSKLESIFSPFGDIKISQKIEKQLDLPAKKGTI